jgi:hypothetical protein
MTPLFSESEVKNLTVEALKLRLRPRLGGMMRAVKWIEPGNRVFRGVVWDHRPDSISKISYPPAACAQLGRLNRAGQPVFYGSCAGPGVFYELKAREGSRIGWSEWEVMEPLWMHNLGYGEDALTLMGAAFNNERLPLVEPFPNETSHSRNLRKKVALAFTVDVPAGNEYLYKQSVALTEFWCEHDQKFPSIPGGPKTDEVAGISYPSLQMRGDADNLVIWPKFAHSSLLLKQVHYVLVEKADYSSLSFTLLTLDISHSFIDGTAIKWRSDLPSEGARRAHISLEHGKWVQRDGWGNVHWSSS